MEEQQEDKRHVPVLLHEVLELLRPEQCRVIVDGTLGHAGHAEALMRRAQPNTRLIGIDRDARNILVAKEHLRPFGERVQLVEASYAQLDDILQKANIQEVDAVLLDVGFSSAHVDDPARGFSFLHEGPLDMRYNRTSGETAADIVNTESVSMLAEIFRVYGEELQAARLAEAIVERRKNEPFVTTTDLAECIAAVIPRRGKMHPATKVFQALRIAVNDELAALKQVIPIALTHLSLHGRLGIISFHSLEDRLVKKAFREAAETGSFRLVTKRPIVPSKEETSRNSRSRSAKFRGIERVAL